MLSPMSEETTQDAPPPNADAKPEDDSWRDLVSQSVGAPGGDDSSALALSRLHGVRIFIAAQDPMRRTALARVLRSLELGVETGAPDESGYRAAIAFQPDAVVSELTRPGEPGWWLLQRLRRHPLLRWTPVLLMRWWKDDGKSASNDVLISRVVENLAESLTPLRVIEERVAAGRPLGDRLEITGAMPLLKVLCGVGVTGTLSINDGWNVFEIDLADGKPRRATRRGMGDDETQGEAALFEAALCDFGRWTFKAHSAPPPVPNLKMSLEEIFERISRRAALVFGPDAVYLDGSLAKVAVRLDLLRDVSSTTSGLAHQLCEILAVGASPEEMAKLLREGEDRLVIERTIIALMRCGALVPLARDEGAASSPGPDAARVARSASHVLAWLAAEHKRGPSSSAEERAAGGKTSPITGYYQISPKREEHIALGPAEGIVAPGAWRPSMTEDLAPDYYKATPIDDRARSAHRPTPELKEDSSPWNGPRASGLTDEKQRPAPALFDSLAPSPREREDRGRRGFFFALGLAILLGALLAAGLVAIGSSSREEPSVKTERR